MTMPHMTGLALSREMMKIKPDVPIILTTGFSELVDKKKAAQAGIGAFIMKPVTISELAETIRNVLNRF